MIISPSFRLIIIPVVSAGKQSEARKSPQAGQSAENTLSKLEPR